MGHTVGVNEHVGPDHLGARLAQKLHQHGIPVPVDVFHDPEDAGFRIDRADRAVLGDPHLRQIITHEPAAGHGRGGLAAPTRGRAGKPSHTPPRPFDPGDKHVLREFHARVFVDGLVHRKAMVAFFEQQGVAGVGAVAAVGRPKASVHEHTGLGQVLGPVQAFAVEIGVEMAAADHLAIESLECVAVEDLGAVGDIGRTADFQGGIGYRRADRPPHVETDHHGFVAHDARHPMADFLQGLVTQLFERQGRYFLIGIHDIERAVDDAALLFFEIEMDRVLRHGQLLFLAFFQRMLPYPLPVGVRTGVDENGRRVAQRDGIRDLDQDLRGLNPADAGVLFGIHVLPEETLGSLDRFNAPENLGDVIPRACMAHGCLPAAG